MTITASDDFNRANDPTGWGSNWSEDAGSGEILTNRGRGTSGGTIMRAVGAFHAALADCEVSVTHVTGSGFDGGPIARKTDGATLTYYEADAYAGNIDIYRVVGGGAPVQIGASGAITLTANSVIKLKVTGTGATVTLIATYAGTEEVNTTDTNASRITAAGQGGTKNYSANADFDNWQIDDLAVAGGNPFFGMFQPEQSGNAVVQRY